VHLVRFIIRIYHDARSPECQITANVDYCGYLDISHFILIYLPSEYMIKPI